MDIILPIRGHSPYLVETLRSISSQDFQDFKLILVCEDVDKSSLSKILAELEFKFPAQVLEVTKGSGLSKALNIGIESGESRYIARIDGDDRMHEQRIRTQLQFLQDNLEVGIVGSQARVINSKSQQIGKTRLPHKHDEIQKLLTYRNAIVHPSVMMRRELIQTLGGYKGKFDGAEDYELWTRAVRISRIENLATALTDYRIHENQVSANNVIARAKLEREIQTNYLNHFHNVEVSNKRIVDQVTLNYLITKIIRVESAFSKNRIMSKSIWNLLRFAFWHPIVTLQTAHILVKYRKQVGKKN